MSVMESIDLVKRLLAPLHNHMEIEPKIQKLEQRVKDIDTHINSESSNIKKSILHSLNETLTNLERYLRDLEGLSANEPYDNPTGVNEQLSEFDDELSKHLILLSPALILNAHQDLVAGQKELQTDILAISSKIEDQNVMLDKLYQEKIGSDSESPEVTVQEANDLKRLSLSDKNNHAVSISSKSPKKAIDLLTEVITDPLFAGALSNRGSFQYKAGKTSAGFEDCNMALKINPDCIHALICRAEIYLYMAGNSDKEGDLETKDKHIQAALGDTRRLITLAPDNPYGHYYRGIIRLQQGENNYTQILKDFLEAKKCEPKPTELRMKILINIAYTYAHLEQFDDALKIYDELLDKNLTKEGRSILLENKREVQQRQLAKKAVDMVNDAHNALKEGNYARSLEVCDRILNELELDEAGRALIKKFKSKAQKGLRNQKVDQQQGSAEKSALEKESASTLANGQQVFHGTFVGSKIVYDKHRRGYAAMRQTVGFKLLHAVSAPARLIADVLASKRPIVMTQSSDGFALTLPEASTDTASSSEVDVKSSTRLMPTLSFEETYYMQPELPFDTGAWDPKIDQHSETGAPIFTYRVFQHAEEVGSARFYQHPMLCRSKTGNRHNVLELTGVLNRLDTETMAANTDEICASLPPTLIERLGESATRGVKWGAWRGITGVVEHGMKRRGYSSKASKWVAQGLFYGGLFVSNLYQRVSVKQAHAQSLTDEDMLSATTEALVDTGTVFASQQLLTKAGQALHATGRGLTRRGWTKTGSVLQTVSGWLGYGMYGVMAYQQGAGQALAQVAGGAVGEVLVTRAGTAVVDGVVPAYASPLTQAANASALVVNLEDQPAEPVSGTSDDSLGAGKEEADAGAGMGLVD